MRKLIELALLTICMISAACALNETQSIPMSELNETIVLNKTAFTENVTTLIGRLDGDEPKFINVTATSGYLSRYQNKDPAKIVALVQAVANKKLDENILQNRSIENIEDIVLTTYPLDKRETLRTAGSCWYCQRGEGTWYCVEVVCLDE